MKYLCAQVKMKPNALGEYTSLQTRRQSTLLSKKNRKRAGPQEAFQRTGGCPLEAPFSALEAAKGFKMTSMADMLSHPFPQPPVSGAKQASHMASQIALGSMPENNRCLAKSTACRREPPFTSKSVSNRLMMTSTEDLLGIKWDAQMLFYCISSFSHSLKCKSCLVTCCHADIDEPLILVKHETRT